MRRVLATSDGCHSKAYRLTILELAQIAQPLYALRRRRAVVAIKRATATWVRWLAAAFLLAIFALSGEALSQTPSITSLSATSGTTGTSVTVTGTNFGGSQGSSAVKFNGTTASVTSWSNTQIGTSVPSSAATGPVTVTVGANTSNGVTFTVIPSITSLSPSSGPANALFTIYGTGFGSTKGTSSVSVNGSAAAASSWSTSQLIVQVPTGAVTGPVTVTVGGNTSNSASFTVFVSGNLAGYVKRASNGNPISGATVKTYLFGALQASATSAADGSYSFSSIAPGAYTLVCTASGFSAVTLASIPVSAGATATAKIVLGAPIVTGISPAAGPLGTTVTISGSGFGALQGSSTVTFNGTLATPTRWSDTSIDTNVPNGSTTGAVVATVGGVPSNGVNFSVGTGAFTGTVSRASDGVHISGARVQAFQGGSPKGSGTTDSNGNYTIGSLAAGAYDLVGSAATYGSAISSGLAAVVGASTTANFSLSSTPGAISGKVTQSGGTTPIAGATIRAYKGLTTLGTATTDISGNYTLGSLGAGTYSVDASSSSFNLKTNTGVTVTLGSTSTSNFSLPSRDAVTYIYDQAGKLIGVVDQNSNSAKYSYDAAGNILSIGNQASTQVSIVDFSPKSGPATATVTVHGTGFSASAGQNSVTFNGVAATVTSSTATQIVATVPTGATTGAIRVTSPSGSATSSSSFTVTTSGGAAPTITSFTPAIAAAGTSVTVNGTNFDPTASKDALAVNLTRTFASAATSTSLSTSIPGVITSGHLSVTTLNGSGSSSSFLFVPPPPHAISEVAYTGQVAPGGNATVTLGVVNKLGLVAMDLSAGQRLSIATNNTFGAGAAYTIYDPYGNSLITGNIATGSTTAITNQSFPFSGTYTIMIAPGNHTGGVTLTPALISPDIIGSISINGPPVTVGPTVAGQDARLTFYATSGQKISLRVTNVTNPSASVVLLRPDGAFQQSIPITGGSGAFYMDTQSLLLPGIYTIWVQHSGSNAGSETAQLYGAPEPDIQGTLTMDGSAVSVGPTTLGQDVRLTFVNATPNQRIVLYATAVSNPDAGLQIMRPDGSQQAYLGISNNPAGKVFFIDTQTLPTAGTYTVWVQHHGANVGSETLQLKSVPADITGSISIDGSAVTVGPTVVGQDVRLSFTTTTTNHRVALSATAVSNPDAGLQIMNPDGSQHVYLGLNSSGYPNNSFFIDTQTLATVGTYAVFVQHHGTNVGSETLRLISVPADITGTMSVNGAAVRVPNTGNTVAGQNATLTLSGTASQTVTVHLTSNTINGVTVTLFKPDGSYFTNATSSASSFNLSSVTLATTGTYSVKVDPPGGNTGNITVSVTSP